jgi:hypothetical protein
VVACEVPDGVEYITWDAETRLLQERDSGSAPAPSFSIANTYPNPSRATTWIELTLPREGRINVAIVDAQGRRVATVADEPRGKGAHQLAWNGRTASGGSAAPGVYQAVVTFEGETRVRRFVRLR